MEKNELDQLINTLGFIALHKSMLPLNLRGWFNTLGLHVQERKAGSWTRLQAGGSLSSYLDVWQEGDGAWEVRKFDENTWRERFSHLVFPTYNIADYLVSNVNSVGELDREKGNILVTAIENFKKTNEWLWLPGIPADDFEVSKQISQLEHNSFKAMLTQAEELRRNSQEPFDWKYLAILYDFAGRYKDMEIATKVAHDLVCKSFKGSEWMAWHWLKTLGMVYYAAYQNSKDGKKVVIFGNSPSKVTPVSLNYTNEEVRELVVNIFNDIYTSTLKSGNVAENPELEEIEEILQECGINNKKPQ